MQSRKCRILQGELKRRSRRRHYLHDVYRAAVNLSEKASAFSQRLCKDKCLIRVEDLAFQTDNRPTTIPLPDHDVSCGYHRLFKFDLPVSVG